MLNYRQNKHELAALRTSRCPVGHVRLAHRINDVILPGSYWPPAKVADDVLIDPDTTRNHFSRQ